MSALNPDPLAGYRSGEVVDAPDASAADVRDGNTLAIIVSELNSTIARLILLPATQCGADEDVIAAIEEQRESVKRCIARLESGEAAQERSERE